MICLQDKLSYLRYRASGYPTELETEEQKQQYLDELDIREGVKIEKHEMVPNASLRALAKSHLNVW